jgi:predicted AAA+ superfamily ATPase
MMNQGSMALIGRDNPLAEALLAAAATARHDARATLAWRLVDGGLSDVPAAIAAILQFDDAEAWDRQPWPPGVRAWLERDVARLMEAHASLAATPDGKLPLSELAGAPAGGLAELRLAVLEDGASPGAVLNAAASVRERFGGGTLARHTHLVLRDGNLAGVTAGVSAGVTHLVGVETPVAAVRRNLESWVAGGAALDVLAYGPRGSGKSTAVRGLLNAFVDRGVRPVEVPADALGQLPHLVERLAGRPERFALFVDDLSYERPEDVPAALKSWLDGSLGGRPDNVRLFVTSNRRRLVRQRFSERPGLDDDDPQRWDTQQDRMALADRFGLVAMFPTVGRTTYLAIATELAERRGIYEPKLEAKAVMFAQQGHGFSGRSATQFVDALAAGLL